MDFIAELKVTVRITARDLPRAKAVLEEKHGCMVGGGRTDKSKEYFIREISELRKTITTPVPAEDDDSKPLDVAALIRKYSDIHSMDQTKFGMKVHVPGEKINNPNDGKFDVEKWVGVNGGDPVDLSEHDVQPNVKINGKPVPRIEDGKIIHKEFNIETKPKSRFTRKA